MTATKQIYLALQDEGTECWRPVDARPLGEDRYQILSVNAHPEDERWEFQSGDVVRCRPRAFDAREELVAFALFGVPSDTVSPKAQE